MSYDESCFKYGWEFIRAVEQSINLDKSLVPEIDQTKMSSLFKQASMGDMEIELPSDDDKTYQECLAWESLTGTTKQEAMLMYIDLSSELFSKYPSIQ